MTDMLRIFLKDLDELLKMRWRLVVIVFLVGLCMHAIVFFRAHNEGDELIYRTLVEQLENGRGYTLQGSQLLEKGLIDKSQYDHPLFFHPPGGISLYWGFHRIFGDWGFPLVQLFSYALFFWSMIFLAKSINLTSSNIALTLVAILSAFNPIMSHVTAKFWLDGPLLAFTTLAVATYVWALATEVIAKSPQSDSKITEGGLSSHTSDSELSRVRKPALLCKLIFAIDANNKNLQVFIAGLILGYASLIKITAFLVVPGVLLMGWFLIKPPRMGRFVFTGLLFLATAFVIQAPWELWQWTKLGSMFPSWAGKPSRMLIESNRYVCYLTEIRSPWIYLRLTPLVILTSIPTFLMFAVLWRNNPLRWLRLSLLTWILIVLAFHTVLGFMGYSKVLRYTILMVPAFIILFTSLLDESVYKLRNEMGDPNTRILAVIIIVSMLAIVLEIATGIHVTLFTSKDIIYNIIGGTWMMQ